MKYHLEEEYEYDFELFGISTHEKDYRLCWAINNSLKISLERTSEDVELIFPHQKEKYGKFPVFKFEQNEGLDVYYLVGNKWENSQLIEEQKHVDFFLMIQSNHETKNKIILTKLKEIPFVLSAYEVNVKELKSKENLIF